MLTWASWESYLLTHNLEQPLYFLILRHFNTLHHCTYMLKCRIDEYVQVGIPLHADLTEINFLKNLFYIKKNYLVTILWPQSVLHAVYDRDLYNSLLVGKTLFYNSLFYNSLFNAFVW